MFFAFIIIPACCRSSGSVLFKQHNARSEAIDPPQYFIGDSDTMDCGKAIAVDCRSPVQKSGNG